SILTPKTAAAANSRSLKRPVCTPTPMTQCKMLSSGYGMKAAMVHMTLEITLFCVTLEEHYKRKGNVAVNLSPLARGKSTPRKRIWPIPTLLIPLFVTGLFFYTPASGLVSLPPPGKTLNPNAGIWNAAKTADLQSTETLHFQDLQKPVTVTF